MSYSKQTWANGDIITAAKLNHIEDGIAGVEADAKSAIADDFSTSTAYAAGDYAIYNGHLYCFTAAHAAGAWIGTDAVQVQLAEDVADLKSTINALNNQVFETEPPKNIWESPTQPYASTGVSYSKSGEEYTLTMTVAGKNKGDFFTAVSDVSDSIGKKITVSAKLKSKTVSGTPTIRPNFLDENGNPLYGSTTYQFTINTSTRTSKTLQVPENAVSMAIGFYCGATDTAIGTTWTVENVQVELGESATNYVPPGESVIVSVVNETKVTADRNKGNISAVNMFNMSNDKLFCGGRIRECINPYKRGGNLQLKGQLHCHATSNDGTVLSTMQQIFDNYKTIYDFMSLTDYGFTADLDNYNTLVQLNDAQETYNLIQLFKGYEAKIVGGNGVKQYHLIVWSPKSIDTFDTGTPPQEVIDYLTDNGCICDMPHLTYSGYTSTDAEKINVRFTEVVSGSSLSETQWDAMLTNGTVVFGLGVSDCHGTGSAIEAAYILLFASEKNRRSIYDSLVSGNFYASDGAAITSVLITDDRYTVETGDAGATIVFSKENGSVVKTVNAATGYYDFDGTEKYVRAKVTDSNSKHAWTQPVIFLDRVIQGV